MLKQILITVLMVVITVPAVAKKYERDYQQVWCDAEKGRTEVVLKDRTRVDCLTATHAVEFDYAYKWAEAIGQSLGYALETKRKPGVVLIIRTDKDWKYVRKLKRINSALNLGITVWVVQGE